MSGEPTMADIAAAARRITPADLDALAARNGHHKAAAVSLYAAMRQAEQCLAGPGEPEVRLALEHLQHALRRYAELAEPPMRPMVRQRQAEVRE